MFKKCKITSYINGQWARALSKISEIDERYSKKCMILYIYNKSKAILIIYYLCHKHTISVFF